MVKFQDIVASVLLTTVFVVADASAAEGERARDLGIPFVGQPGPLNAITDVEGIEVGHVTLVNGDGALVVGKGPVRTGVTVIHPRGKESTDPVFAGWFTLNASGEMTGTTWHAPVVAETYDGGLNDINGFHVTREHALEAMRKAAPGQVTEGAVGGGTGMVCNGFKGGIGTASREFEVAGETYTVGVLVQCNYNWDGDDFRLGGRKVDQLLPVGKHCFTDPSIERHVDWYPYCDARADNAHSERTRDGSIIIVVATDAPLLPHQLRRVAKRPSLGLGRLGAISSDGSGDIFVAFSTANSGRISETDLSDVSVYPNNTLRTVFAATVQATEEAVVNAMVAADTVIGVAGFRVKELPEPEVRKLFERGTEKVPR